MPHITPTVGRKVYFYADDQQQEPHDATVIKVLAGTCAATPFTPVNLLVIDPDDGSGTFHPQVVHSPTPVPYPHYRWMPYQYEQAVKKELNMRDVILAKEWEAYKRAKLRAGATFSDRLLREQPSTSASTIGGGGGGVGAGCCATAQGSNGTAINMNQQLYDSRPR